jgi:hypothetical protein
MLLKSIMFTRENITLVVIALCVISTVYLFKEMRDLKNAPPQVMRVPYPVQMSKERMEAPPVSQTRQIEVHEEEEEEEVKGSLSLEENIE